MHIGHEHIWFNLGGRRLDAEQIRPPRQGWGDRPGRLAHAAAERVADDRVAAVLPDCVPYLGIHSWGFRCGGHEGGTDGAATRPRTGALQLPEGSAGLNSSNRPGGHEQLRR